jgi:intracellular proteinase inhibitor BsuPI
MSGPGGPRVAVELLVPPSVQRGETLEIAIRVRNEGTQPAELELPGRPIAFDVVIRAADGAEVWRRLRGGAVAGLLAVLRLAPGEAHDFSVRWAGVDEAGRPAPAGRYTVQGVIPFNGRRSTTAVRTLVIRG